MRIRMLTAICGNGFSLSIDEETDRFDEREAMRLIESGQAVPVAERKVEKTERPPARETRSTLSLPKKG